MDTNLDQSQRQALKTIKKTKIKVKQALRTIQKTLTIWNTSITKQIEETIKILRNKLHSTQKVSKQTSETLTKKLQQSKKSVEKELREGKRLAKKQAQKQWTNTRSLLEKDVLKKYPELFASKIQQRRDDVVKHIKKGAIITSEVLGLALTRFNSWNKAAKGYVQKKSIEEELITRLKKRKSVRIIKKLPERPKRKR